MAQRVIIPQPRAERSDALGHRRPTNHAPQRGAGDMASPRIRIFADNVNRSINPSSAPLGRMAFHPTNPGASLRSAPGYTLVTLWAIAKHVFANP